MPSLAARVAALAALALISAPCAVLATPSIAAEAGDLLLTTDAYNTSVDALLMRLASLELANAQQDSASRTELTSLNASVWALQESLTGFKGQQMEALMALGADIDSVNRSLVERLTNESGVLRGAIAAVETRSALLVDTLEDSLTSSTGLLAGLSQQISQLRTDHTAVDLAISTRIDSVVAEVARLGNLTATAAPTLQWRTLAAEGGLLKVFGHGFVPNEKYRVRLTSVSGGQSELSAEETLDYPTHALQLGFAPSFQAAPVPASGLMLSVRLFQGTTEVPYVGPAGRNTFLYRALIDMVPAQFVYSIVGTGLIVSTGAPYNDAVPLISMGGEVVSQTITPLDASSQLVIRVMVHAVECTNTGNWWIASVFESGKSAALCTAVEEALGNTDSHDGIQTLALNCVVPAVTTATRKYVVRAGLDGGSLCVNRIQGRDDPLGDALKSSIFITEVGAAKRSLKFADVQSRGHELVKFTSTQSNRQSVVGGNIPWDYSLPQRSEGAEVLRLTVTPQAKDNILFVEASASGVNVNNAGADHLMLCLFSDQSTSALSCSTDELGDSGNFDHYGSLSTLYVRHAFLAPSTAQLTLSIRMGLQKGTLGLATTRRFGNVLGGSIPHTLSVKEIRKLTGPPQFKPLPAQLAQSVLTSFRFGSNNIPWNTNRPTSSSGTLLVSMTYVPTKASKLVIEGQTYNTEHSNTADNSILVLVINNVVVATGVEEDTRGQQNLHQTRLRFIFDVSSVTSLQMELRGAVNGGRADFNGRSSRKYGGSLQTSLIVEEFDAPAPIR